MKSKLILFVLVVFVIGFSGCLGGRGPTQIERAYLDAGFDVSETNIFLVLDASKTEAVGFSSVEYLWLIDGHEFQGTKVKVPLPHGEILIQLTVIGRIRDEQVVDIAEYLYQPPNGDPDPTDPDPADPDPVDPDPEPGFEVQRIGELYYKFTAPQPEGAKFWEWKFPEQKYWEGYIDNNIATHKFSTPGTVEVKLAIFGEYGKQIGEIVVKEIEIY